MLEESTAPAYPEARLWSSGPDVADRTGAALLFGWVATPSAPLTSRAALWGSLGGGASNATGAAVVVDGAAAYIDLISTLQVMRDGGKDAIVSHQQRELPGPAP